MAVARHLDPSPGRPRTGSGMSEADQKTSPKDLSRNEPRALEANTSVSFLEQALWQNLAESATVGERLQAWLSLLSGRSGQLRAGVVLLAQDGSNLAPEAVWPAGTQVPAGLIAAAEEVLATGHPIARGQGRAEGADVALPITSGGEVVAIVAVGLTRSGEEDIRASFQDLRWGSAWIRMQIFERGLDAAHEMRDRTALALETLVVALDETSFRPAAMAFVTHLAEQFACDRVSLGFERRGSARVAVISRTARFSREMKLVRLIAAAMNEAIDQRAVISHPPLEDEPLVTRAHDDLAAVERPHPVLTVPLLDADRLSGAMTLERPAGAPEFSPAEVRALEFVGACIAPVIADKKLNDRLLVLRAIDWVDDVLRGLIGPTRFGRKLGLAAVLAIVAFFSFATTDYRVAADARIDGKIRRVITAPFDGFIYEAPVRPGDVVEAGATLLALDERDLMLERLKLAGERSQQVSLLEKAIGERNPSEMGIARARVEKVDAEIALVEERLERAKVTAPLDGVVVSGDLSQRIAGAVRKGDVLMEVAPLDEFRVILNVVETQLGDVHAGQRGELIVASLPERTFSIEVERITPVAVQEDGRTSFRVEAAVVGDLTRLRPGMEGVAKLDAGERLLIWTWARPFLDWARIFFWRWSG